MSEHEHEWNYLTGSFIRDHVTMGRGQYLVQLRCECDERAVALHTRGAMPRFFMGKSLADKAEIIGLKEETYEVDILQCTPTRWSVEAKSAGEARTKALNGEGEEIIGTIYTYGEIVDVRRV